MTFVVTLGSVTLEAANSVIFNTQGNITQFTLPPTGGVGAGDINARIFDLLGAGTIITVIGVFAPLPGKTVKEQFDEVNDLITGNQSAIIFSTSSGLFDDQSVMLASLQTTWDVPANKAEYEIKMFKGLRA